MFELISTIETEYLKIPNYQEFKGKRVLITITEVHKKSKLKNFFEAAGQIELDNTDIIKLRDNSIL